MRRAIKTFFKKTLDAIGDLFCSNNRYAKYILNMVGPKKQDLWPKINLLKGNHNIFENMGSTSSSKIGLDFDIEN